MLKALYEDIMSLLSILIFHLEVRRLLRGKILIRLFVLEHEVQIIFENIFSINFQITRL